MIDLFSGWRRAPIESLVDMLRAVHERNVREAEERAVHERNGGDSEQRAVHGRDAGDGEQRTLHANALDSEQSAPAASGDPGPPGSATAAHAARFVAALLAWPAPSQTAPAAELSYDALSRRVLDFQTQVRRQKLALERLLGHAFVADDSAGTLVPTFQQTLYLQCPRNGRSAGRFRCVNRKTHAASLEITCAPVIGQASGRLAGARVLFEPPTAVLGAGDALTLQAMIDLTRCGPIDDGEVGAAAEIRLDGDCVLKLWIAVELT